MSNVKLIIVGIIFFIFSISNSGAQHLDQVKPIQFEGFFEKNLPDSIPKIFAPGNISIDGYSDYICSIHPNMKLIVWTSSRDFGKTIDHKYKRLIYIKKEANSWSQPKQLLFSDKFSEEEGIFSCDGTRLYYSSNRPDKNDTDLWYAEISEDGWEQPQKLEIPNMPEGRQIYVTTTVNGSLYFCSRGTKENDHGYFVYRSIKNKGNFSEPELIMEGAHPYVHPEEKYILIDIYDTIGDNKCDIGICFKLKDNSFSKPISIGDEINTTFDETCATLSPDKKYIFFGRYDEPDENSNIYWVSSSIIEKIENEYKK